MHVDMRWSKGQTGCRKAEQMQGSRTKPGSCGWGNSCWAWWVPTGQGDHLLGALEQGAESDFSLKGSKYLPQARSDSVVCGRIGQDILEWESLKLGRFSWELPKPCFCVCILNLQPGAVSDFNFNQPWGGARFGGCLALEAQKWGLVPPCFAYFYSQVSWPWNSPKVLMLKWCSSTLLFQLLTIPVPAFSKLWHGILRFSSSSAFSGAMVKSSELLSIVFDCSPNWLCFIYKAKLKTPNVSIHLCCYMYVGRQHGRQKWKPQMYRLRAQPTIFSLGLLFPLLEMAFLFHCPFFPPVSRDGVPPCHQE